MHQAALLWAVRGFGQTALLMLLLEPGKLPSQAV